MIIPPMPEGREKNLEFQVWRDVSSGIKQPSVPGVGASASTPGTVFFAPARSGGFSENAKTNLHFGFPTSDRVVIKLSSVPGVETSVSTPGTVFFGLEAT